jgi:hypothetical protein
MVKKKLASQDKIKLSNKTKKFIVKKKRVDPIKILYMGYSHYIFPLLS